MRTAAKGECPQCVLDGGRGQGARAGRGGAGVHARTAVFSVAAMAYYGAIPRAASGPARSPSARARARAVLALCAHGASGRKTLASRGRFDENDQGGVAQADWQASQPSVEPASRRTIPLPLQDGLARQAYGKLENGDGTSNGWRSRRRAREVHGGSLYSGQIDLHAVVQGSGRAQRDASRPLRRDCKQKRLTRLSLYRRSTWRRSTGRISGVDFLTGPYGAACASSTPTAAFRRTSGDVGRVMVEGRSTATGRCCGRPLVTYHFPLPPPRTLT